MGRTQEGHVQIFVSRASDKNHEEKSIGLTEEKLSNMEKLIQDFQKQIE